MRPHQKLEAWIKAIELVTDVYKSSENFPKEERYGLTVQIRRRRFNSCQSSSEVGTTFAKGVRVFSFKFPRVS